jgi:hypothetical protein
MSRELMCKNFLPAVGGHDGVGSVLYGRMPHGTLNGRGVAEGIETRQLLRRPALEGVTIATGFVKRGAAVRSTLLRGGRNKKILERRNGEIQ